MTDDKQVAEHLVAEALAAVEQQDDPLPPPEMWELRAVVGLRRAARRALTFATLNVPPIDLALARVGAALLADAAMREAAVIDGEVPNDDAAEAARMEMSDALEALQALDGRLWDVVVEKLVEVIPDDDEEASSNE
jgi:hypothetical protein